MMTTAAAMLGALPLALGRGVGSEIRRPLGIAIVGGLIVSQMLTLYTTPVVYLYMDLFKDWVMAHLPWRTKTAEEGRSAGLRGLTLQIASIHPELILAVHIDGCEGLLKMEVASYTVHIISGFGIM